MNKFHFFIIRLCFFVLYIAIFIGIHSILPFDNYGFLSLLLTTASIIITIYLISKENEEKIEQILKEAKLIYSLNYTNLKNIRGIELTVKGECFVILNKSGNDFKIKLNNKYIPENQEMLIKLDEMYNK